MITSTITKNGKTFENSSEAFIVTKENMNSLVDSWVQVMQGMYSEFNYGVKENTENKISMSWCGKHMNESYFGNTEFSVNAQNSVDAPPKKFDIIPLLNLRE